MGFVRGSTTWATRQLVGGRGDRSVSNAHRNRGGPTIGTNVSGDVVAIAVDVGDGVALSPQALPLDKVGEGG